MKPIYKAPLIEQLKDLRRSIEIAIDLLDTTPMRVITWEDTKREGLADGEMAVCDWVIRPRFTEAQKSKTFAQWWDSLPRGRSSSVDSRRIGESYELGFELAILVWDTIHDSRCSP